MLVAWLLWYVWRPIRYVIGQTPIALLLPWFYPFEVWFDLTHGGIRFWVGQRGVRYYQWWLLVIGGCLPPTLQTAIRQHQRMVLAYPHAKVLHAELTSYYADRCITYADEMTGLVEGLPPHEYAITYTFTDDYSALQCGYSGIEHYLGAGWFQWKQRAWRLGHLASASAEEEKNLIEGVIPVSAYQQFFEHLLPSMSAVLPIQLNFAMIADFALQVTARVERHDSLQITVTSNYPALMRELRYLPGTNEFVHSGANLIVGSEMIRAEALLRLATQPQPVALAGQAVPEFVVNTLADHATELGIDRAALLNQIGMKQRGDVSIGYKTQHEIVNGIGVYRRVGLLQHAQGTMAISSVLQQLNAGNRFVDLGRGWLDIPLDEKHSVKNWLNSNQKPQVLLPHQLLGVALNSEPVAPLDQELFRPVGASTTARAASLFTTLRTHGMPGGLIGHPWGMTAMLSGAALDLLQVAPRANILWVAPVTVKGAITRELAKHAALRQQTTVIAPNNWNTGSFANTHWHMMIIQDLDSLLQIPGAASLLGGVMRNWCIMTVLNPPPRAIHPALTQAIGLPPEAYLAFTRMCLQDVDLRAASSPSQPVAPTTTAAPRAVATSSGQKPPKQGIQFSESTSPRSGYRESSAADGRVARAMADHYQAWQAQPAVARQVVVAIDLAKARALYEDRVVPDRLALADSSEHAILPQVLNAARLARRDSLVEREATSIPPEEDDADARAMRQFAAKLEAAHWAMLAALIAPTGGDGAAVARQFHKAKSVILDDINEAAMEVWDDFVVESTDTTPSIQNDKRAIIQRLLREHGFAEQS